MPCWFKSMGLRNVEGTIIFGEETECGRVFCTEFKSNLPNWIKSKRGQPKLIISTNVL